MRAVGLAMFRKMFSAMRFSIFIPKKDQCEKCMAAKVGNLSNDLYNEHVEQKNLARETKEKDKDDAKDDKVSKSVWTMDLPFQLYISVPKQMPAQRTTKQKSRFYIYDVF